MLRKGQLVQISKTARISEIYSDGTTYSSPSPRAGEITTVVLYLGLYTSFRTGVEEEYYLLANSPLKTARSIIFPIDDEPCDEEFLNQFLTVVGQINETENS